MVSIRDAIQDGGGTDGVSQEFLNQDVETSVGTEDNEPNPANAPSATGAPGMGFDADDPRDAPSARGSSDPTAGGSSTSDQTESSSESNGAMNTPGPNLPGFGDVQDEIDERVSQVEQQFRSEIDQTQDTLNSQIDAVTGSVSDLSSNVQDSFSSLGSGLESTQNAVSSIPGSIAAILNGQEQQSGGGESDGISTTTLAAGAVAVAAVAYSLTQ